MPQIHFVERLQNVHRVDKEKNEWESGYWVVGEDAAQRLIGGSLYLHSKQNEPSHFGGQILSYRVQVDGDLAGRLIFRFRMLPECKGVITSRSGWGNEKKIVWD